MDGWKTYNRKYMNLLNGFLYEKTRHDKTHRLLGASRFSTNRFRGSDIIPPGFRAKLVTIPLIVERMK